MHKDELIQLHTLMVQIKKYFEHSGLSYSFNEYDSLCISPLHVHRSKTEHKHAIFVLGSDIACALSDDDMSSIGRTCNRMHEFAIRVSNEQLTKTN